MAKGRERTTKFYFRNENEVMRELGLEPAKGSGSGWIDKEDGSNDFLIAQLKSTDKQQYTVKQLDIKKLEYHAQVSNKTPLFIIQFLNNDTRYAMMAIEDIPKVNEYLNTGEISNTPSEVSELIKGIAEKPDKKPRKKKPKVVSDAAAREEYNRMMEEERENKRWQK